MLALNASEACTNIDVDVDRPVLLMLLQVLGTTTGAASSLLDLHLLAHHNGRFVYAKGALIALAHAVKIEG